MQLHCNPPGGIPNNDCLCATLDAPALEAAVRSEGMADAVLAERPHLFSPSPVFVSRRDMTAMTSIVRAIEETSRLASYRDLALRWAPGVAHFDPGPRGAFMGYDFHMADGPRLIEINTNAGGALLNAALARAQHDCCDLSTAASDTAGTAFGRAVWDMFVSEWRLQGRTGLPRTVAIVDDQPATQYLFPEFVMMRSLLERNGVRALIVDPADLVLEDGVLMHGGEVDMVYNRLVDFAFEHQASRALRMAWLHNAAVITPNPHNHALLADKRNLTILSAPDQLERLGLAEQYRRELASLPRAVIVTDENAPELWAARKSYFFKPAGGHGGKAVYRGDKIARGVFERVAQGGYIAQELVAPSERRIRLEGGVHSLKLDVRLYTYQGEPLLAAARIYQGQTTNFRTPGGGFAPVYLV